jgi:stage II sporulation protein M
VVEKSMGQTISYGLFGHIREALPAYILLAAVLLGGIIIGVVAPTALPQAQVGEVQNFAATLINQVPTANINGWQEAFNCLLFNGGMLLLIWVFGVSVVGGFLSVPVLFYKGFTLGFSISILLSQSLSKGFVLVLLTILPQNLLLIPIFIFSVYQAVIFSRDRLWRQQNSELFITVLGKYSQSFLLVAIILLLASLVQGWVAPLFLQMFLAVI